MANLKKDIDQLLRTLQNKYDCTVTTTRTGHWKVRRPGHPHPVIVSGSPSDKRALRNTLAYVRKNLGISL